MSWYHSKKTNENMSTSKTGNCDRILRINDAQYRCSNNFVHHIIRNKILMETYIPYNNESQILNPCVNQITFNGIND